LYIQTFVFGVLIAKLSHVPAVASLGDVFFLLNNCLSTFILQTKQFDYFFSVGVLARLASLLVFNGMSNQERIKRKGVDKSSMPLH